MKRVAGALVVAGVLIATASIAHAGWVLTEANGDETVISNGKMRSGWENGSMIFDAGTKQVHFLDNRRKLISSGTVDELCQGIEQMMESMMQQIPPEQREMMKKMMGGSDVVVEIVDKGAGDKIAGFETTRFEVMLGGELYEEVWLSNDKALVEECQEIMKMLGRFMSCMSGLSAMGGEPSPESSPEYAKLFEAGVFVKSVEHGDNGDEANVTMIKQRDVEASVFSLPEGYKEVPLSTMWGMGGQ